MLRSNEVLKSDEKHWSDDVNWSSADQLQEPSLPSQNFGAPNQAEIDPQPEQTVTFLYEHCPGPLPLAPASLKTQGGLLYVYCAGSAWVRPEQAARGNSLGFEIWIDGSQVGEASELAYHPGQLFFRARFALRLPAGDFSVELRPIEGTRTHASDLFHLAIVEFPRTSRASLDGTSIDQPGMDRPVPVLT